MDNVIARDKETGRVEAIRCLCGGRVHLSQQGYDTSCEKCGQPYNCFGQRLRRGHDGECCCLECSQ